MSPAQAALLADPARLRCALIFRTALTKPWEETFPLASVGRAGWQEGALQVKHVAFGEGATPGQHTTITQQARETDFFPEIKERLLNADVRRWQLLANPWKLDIDVTPRSGESEHPGDAQHVQLLVQALETLRVEEKFALVVVHAEVTCTGPDEMHRALRLTNELMNLIGELQQRLAADAHCGDLELGDSGEIGGQRPARPFVLTWVPASRWQATAGDDTALAEAGWRWGHLQGTWGPPYDDTQAELARERLERFSSNWAVAVYPRGVAVLPSGADNRFWPLALGLTLTQFADVCLLLELDRLQVRKLSHQLAKVARDVERSLSELADNAGPSTDRDALIYRALQLDGRAAVFLASEWWTDVTERINARKLLTKLQDVSGVNEMVTQVAEQARTVRESVQSLLEYREQRSARFREKALGLLGFVGVPLTVCLELWANWSAVPIAERLGSVCGVLSFAWWVVAVPILIGLVVALMLKVPVRDFFRR
ncbi:hypothetical protein EII12_06025 [Buchananella hordeovulneris]|uniref:hypothetical protein n=1 Tax=Buchananella hordeovulneris TaxID=52770 RepID=UPI000F5F89ED|nr:hypothetical protein [Buchananella hordeovulneris]RRD52100.1 hypothetical protein EII12_06025 [Buchananella hordeovulneris]